MDTTNDNPNPQAVNEPTQTLESPKSVFLGRGETVTINFHGAEFKARKLSIADTDLIKMRVLRSQIGPFRAYLMAFHKAIENFYPDIKVTDILEDVSITEDEVQDLIINQMPKIGFNLGAKKKLTENPPTKDTPESQESTLNSQNSSDTPDTL